jgi:molybdopterin molybdotransferase
MRTAAEASAQLLARAQPMPSLSMPLPEAHARVLAEDAIATVTLPPWPNAAMDGYAVRAVDVQAASAAAPVTLPVFETIAAGAFPSRALAAGEAARIMTGAPVPAGADTVIRVEDTDGGVQRVTVRDARDAGRNVRAAGEDVHAGDRLLAAGAWLGGAQLGLLAAAGVDTVRVHVAPRVAIISSGDELVPLSRVAEARAGRKLVSSNSIALMALVREAGAVPVDFGIVHDDPAELADALRAAAEVADLIITTAGVSVGAFDYTREAVQAAGGTIDFWKVKLRPGAMLGAGQVGAVPWLGLPGNPVSAVVTFELFAHPIIRRMLGHARCLPQAVECEAAEPVRTAGGTTYLLRVVLTPRAGQRPLVALAGGQGSHVQSALARGNALLVVPPEAARSEAGAVLRAIPLGESRTFGTEFPF